MRVFSPWEQYNRSVAACKDALAIILLLLAWALPGIASELSIQSGPGGMQDIHWRSLSIEYTPLSEARPGRWKVEINGLQSGSMGALGDLSVECSDGRLLDGLPACETGQLAWTGNPTGIDWSPQFSLKPDLHGLSARMSGRGYRLEARLPAGDQPVSARLELEDSFTGDLDLSEAWLAGLGLRELAGAVSGEVEYEQGKLNARLEISNGGFDSIDGSLAGDGVLVNLTGEFEPAESGWQFDMDLAQRAGELLLGSVYLPPPADALSLSLTGEFEPGTSLRIHTFRMQDPEAVSLQGHTEMRVGETGWVLHSLVLEQFELRLPGAYDRWADGPLSARNLGGLATTGFVQGWLEWGEDTPLRVRAEALGVNVDDPGERFSLNGLDALLVRSDQRDRLQASWSGLGFYGFPLGGSELDVLGRDKRYSIEKPVILPLLDGAVVIEQLGWAPGDDGEIQVSLDARIDPIDLAALTRLLGFPEFGGRLSGRFPGMVYVDERLSFTGGIDIQAFSGQIRLSDLSVERPFGSLPALAAQVEFERLELGELTGAFNFGDMEGQLSGWMRNLRLLDWRPVAMDARMFTHDDARRRRISQRAIENLSSLGGSPGAALLSSTVMRVFDEFPYRRAGLACRLANNICHINGVAPHESGGFYILEGRSLPRLDIIGHRRLVDWPQLIGQLAAMMEERSGESDEP